MAVGRGLAVLVLARTGSGVLDDVVAELVGSALNRCCAVLQSANTLWGSRVGEETEIVAWALVRSLAGASRGGVGHGSRAGRRSRDGRRSRVLVGAVTLSGSGVSEDTVSSTSAAVG